ncbi:hypothetical protein AB0J42_03650 [Nonomuraea sp. NPDC049649]|uniref:WD40 repeat domain-containing protein n=1 Tax=Nonomuraea sp. NPDC049649 TaxID=3155776 RepID=UPI003449AB9D
MSPRAAALAVLLVLTQVAGCGEDPAAGREAILAPPSGSMTPSPGPPAEPSPTPSRPDLASSLAAPMATGAPLAATGPPRFFVTARTAVVRFPDGSKTADLTPVPPAVHDAATGRLIAEVPLPPGVESSWKLAAAAPDNRTFLLSGHTGLGEVRFFRVRLDGNGHPGPPEPVPHSGGKIAGMRPVLAMSHDGTRFAFADMLPGGAIVAVVDIATGARRDWAAGEGPAVTGLSWSPDGRRIAVANGGWGIGELDLAAPGSDLLAATRLVRPMTGMPLLGSVAYAPDGESLIYSAGHDIERVPVGGGEPEVLARLSPPRGASFSIRFDLDGTGRHLLYTQDWRLHRTDLRDGSSDSVPIGRPSGGLSPDATW